MTARTVGARGGILRRVKRRLSLLVTALAMMAGPVPEAVRAATEKPQERVALYTTTAVLDGNGRQTPISVAMMARGPLFSIRTAVEQLGGTLRVGPLGQSHAVELDGTEFLFGPGSSAITVGQEILELPQEPVGGPLGLHVPLELLEAIYSEVGGLRFIWSPGERRLVVTRAGAESLPVTVDVVHLKGVSTLVLQFPRRPRHRVDSTFPGRAIVHILGDRITPPPTLPRLDEGYLRDIRFGAQEITLALASGAAAESYELTDPYRLVFDIFPGAAPKAAAPGLPPPPRRARIPTIVIDPGHGGSDLGAQSADGLLEKEIALRLARILRTKLQARLPMRVVLTRDEDADLPLETRAAIANQLKAELFISLHLNASFGSSAHGAETYFLSLEASDERAQLAADAANIGSNPRANPLSDLELILWDMAQSQHLARSQHLATLIQEELNEALDLHDRGVKQAPFVVLNGAAMPAVLVEFGFLSNPEEVRLLRDPAYQNELADAIARAFVRYRPAGNRPELEGGEVPE